MAQGSLTLVFDEHFSHKVIEFVARESSGAHEARLIHVRQRGWSQKSDLEWMPEAADEGFVIISADRNERTRKITNAEFARLGARVILLGSFWDHRGRWDRTKWIVSRIDALVSAASLMPPGTVLMTTASGSTRSVL